jgi:hypothetical protein
MTIPPVPDFPEEVWGRRACALVWCCLDSREEASRSMESVGRLPTPIFEHVDEMPFPVLQSLFDPLLPPGLQWYWKGDFFRELSDEAIDVHLDHAPRAPSVLCGMHLYPIDGAVGRVSSTATAWCFRESTWSMVIAGVDDDPENAEAITTWAKDYWEDLHPHSAGASYVNFMMEEGADRVRAAYGPNYERLALVKARYDPDNLFRINQNIPPA